MRSNRPKRRAGKSIILRLWSLGIAIGLIKSFIKSLPRPCIITFIVIVIVPSVMVVFCRLELDGANVALSPPVFTDLVPVLGRMRRSLRQLPGCPSEAENSRCRACRHQ
jgi:hypothetical protein